MSLEKLTNQDLLINVKDLAAHEKEYCIRILHHLNEIESRRLYIEEGFGSLHDFCIGELKYSSAAAHRRITTARLLREFPEIEKMLRDGEVSLTTVCSLYGFFKHEKKKNKTYSPEQKSTFLQSIAGKSKQECEAIYATHAPEIRHYDREKTISENEVEVRFVASRKLIAKLKKIKALNAHKTWDPNYAELFEMMADTVLERIDPERKPSRKVMPPPQIVAKTPPAGQEQGASPLRRKYIRLDTRRAVWQREQSQCSHVDSRIQKRCEATHGLEIDHIVPHAKGGDDSPENLRLLCPAHNQWHAIQSYGGKLISKYVKYLKSG